MFELLVESHPSHAFRRAAVGATPAAFAAHAVAGMLVLYAANAASGVVDRALADTTFVFIRPPAEAPKPEPPAPKAAEPVVAAAAPVAPARGFQTVVAPTEIPKAIPPVDLNQRAFDPRDFTGKGVEGGVGNGVVGGVVGGTGDAAAAAATVVYRAIDLDEPVQLIQQPSLRYPPALEPVAIDGVVDLEFIVGLDGRVEPRSIRVVSSTHPQFEAQARAVALGSVFRPARLQHMPVRQLVAQRYRFSVAR